LSFILIFLIFIPYLLKFSISNAVFSEDSLRAELFLPERGGIVLDRRTLPSGGYAWNIEDDDTYNLRRDVSGGWVAEKSGDVLHIT